MPEICCFDTDVVSCYLVQKPEDPHWVQQNQRAKSLFDLLKKEKTDFYIPSIVLMEILFAFPELDKRHDMHKKLLETFKVANFAPGCAELVPDLLFSNGYEKLNTSLSRKERGIIKEDTKILATALYLGAKTLYTNNKKDFQKIADGRIFLVSLDDIPIQESLFDESLE